MSCDKLAYIWIDYYNHIDETNNIIRVFVLLYERCPEVICHIKNNNTYQNNKKTTKFVKKYKNAENII